VGFFLVLADKWRVGNAWFRLGEDVGLFRVVVRWMDNDNKQHRSITVELLGEEEDASISI
jgi:hypothetical protein